MKAILYRFSMCLVMLCVSILAEAYDFREGNIYYNITDAVKQTVEITYNSAYKYSSYNKFYIPSKVKDGNKTYTVTSIGSQAFKDCGVPSVSIPTTVTSIKSEAFCNSTISSIIIPNSVISIESGAFMDCRSLTSIIIPGSVTSIAGSAFLGCTKLRKCAYPFTISNPFQYATVSVAYNPQGAIIEDEFIYGPEKSSILFAPYTLKGEYTIPNSVTSIGNLAFSYCNSLTNIFIPCLVTSIGDEAFRNCSCLQDIIIPYSVTSIGDGAFHGCSGLTSIYLPNLITSVGNKVFCNCSGLTWVAIPNSVTSIGNNAFQYCSGLTSVTIPNSVTSIGNEAFGYCSGLTEISISNSVTSIGDGAFRYCSGLTEIFIPNSVTSIGNSAFLGCSCLTNISIPYSVTSIGDNAFNACSKLNKFTIEEGDSLLAFGMNVLKDAPVTDLAIGRNWSCSNDESISTVIKSVTIGNKVTQLPNYAFVGCSGLTSVTIPNSVTSIGRYAFLKCSGLKNVITQAMQAPSIFESTFYGLYDKATLSFPKMSADSYFASNWTLFNSIKFIGTTDYVGTYCDDLLIYYLVPSDNDTEKRTAVVKKGDYSAMTSVVIPERFTDENSNRYYVTGICYGAFNGCTALKEVKFTSRCAVQTIGDYAFNRTAITSIELPSTVTLVGNGAFSNCRYLTSASIPNLVTKIGDRTFFGCSNLSSISIPKSVTSIGDEAFANCTNLTSVTIPNSVTSIGDYAFDACSKLNMFTIEEGDVPLELGTDAVAGLKLVIGRNWTYRGSGAISTKIKSVTLGGKVTQLPDNAFKGCKELTSVTIPNSVTSISESAFSGCKLTEVVLPPSVETIGPSAFAGNSGLNKIAMGYKVKTIDENAFQGVNADRVFITAQVPPKAPVSTFSRYAGKLYVQGNAAINAYYDASSCWDRFDVYTMSEPQSLTMEKPKTVEGKAGEQFTLKATLTPANVDLPYIFWRSTNPEKAYVDNEGKVTILQNITADDNVEIIAETLYYNGPIAKFSFFTDSSGVDEIVSDTTSATSTIDVYTLQGVQVLRNATQEDFDKLDSGIYIVRSGKNVKKVIK